MNFKNVTIDQGAFQHVCASLLSFAAHVEGKKVSVSFPKVDSVGLALHMILTGFRNTGKYQAKDLARELRVIANNLDSPQGPVREPKA
jgi:hypothetical protein